MTASPVQTQPLRADQPVASILHSGCALEKQAQGFGKGGSDGGCSRAKELAWAGDGTKLNGVVSVSLSVPVVWSRHRACGGSRGN